MKTKAMINEGVTIQHSRLGAGDYGYIDGYVRGADDRPYAVFVRRDGVIDLVPLHCLTAEVNQ